jgi:hypothetical protein
MPTPEDITLAFALGTPDGGLVHVRRGDADTWRLDTATGSYFVKGYFPAAGVHVTDQLAGAMAFERQALVAGVDMPEPIVPTDPLLGWVTRIEDRLFRVYRWIEQRTPEPDLDIAAWLGRTMKLVHQLQPPRRAGLPAWWRQAVQPPGTWEGWFAKARDRDAAWAGLHAVSLPHLLAITARIADLCDVAPDAVTTHGDFKTHNVVRSPAGPVLVDWDSVRTDSAALEAGRSAYLFAAGEPEQLKRILTAYVAAGGDLGWAGPDLFLSVARNHIQVLSEQIQVALGDATAPRWMGDPATIDSAIGNNLQDLPSKLDHLRALTSTMAAAGLCDG